MFKLQLLLTWRNLLKRKFYSAIEIGSLAIGLTCFILAAVYVKKEFSYESFFSDSRQIYRVLNLEDGSGYRYSGGASALGDHASKEIPQVTGVTRIFYPYRMFSTSALITVGDARFYEDNIIEADTTFFGFFDFTFVEGTRLSALKHTNSVVISEQTARKLFGNQSALGRMIELDSESLEISGVINIPENTHLNFAFLRPAHHDPSQLYVWNHTLAFTYVKVPRAQDVPAVEQQLHALVMKHATDEQAAYLKNYHHQLQPINEIHTTILQWDIVRATPGDQVIAVMAIAVFILVLSIVNFINLTTARAEERIRETGINRLMGASQRLLTGHFFFGFLLIIILAATLALIILMSLLPFFNSLLGIQIQGIDFFQKEVILIIIGIVALTAAMAGVYPAYNMASFHPTQVIRKSFTSSSRAAGLRQTLVAFQFLISIGLLAGTLILRQQIHFLYEADLGFNKTNLVALRLRDLDRVRFEQLKNKLLTYPSIEDIAGASALLGGENGSTTFHPDHMPDPTPETFARYTAVDPNFLNLIGVPIKAGRGILEDNPGDLRYNYIINETAVRQYGLSQPVGTRFRMAQDTQGRIIGVMKDFHFSSLHEPIRPLVFYLDSIQSYQYMFIRISGNPQQALVDIHTEWNNLFPHLLIEEIFQEEYFNALYAQDNQVLCFGEQFTLLATLLACLGLLGTSSFLITKRTKEIGIRKVAGAPVFSILLLITINFLRPILVALLISIPATLYVMERWLSGFSKRIAVSPWIFVTAGVMMIAVALITIIWQSVRAARANPVHALRQE